MDGNWGWCGKEGGGGRGGGGGGREGRRENFYGFGLRRSGYPVNELRIVRSRLAYCWRALKAGLCQAGFDLGLRMW